jgi:prepilin-type N-terminal cleavage/methylation domain-containing protein
MKIIKKGFTLLEILVVMAIISILLYMLVRVMANFRRTVELQQASDLIISSINETKNFSANNVLPDGLVRDDKNIYAYSLVPQPNNIERKVCQKISSSTIWNCSVSPKIDKLLNINNNKIILTADCDSIILINLVNDWQVGNTGTYTDTTCEIEMSHQEDSDIFRKFVFDGTKNTFEVKYGN